MHEFAAIAVQMICEIFSQKHVSTYRSEFFDRSVDEILHPSILPMVRCKKEKLNRFQI